MIKNNLEIELAGFWPRIDIKNKKLRKKIGKDFLGPDYIISFLQKAVYKSVPLIEGLEEEILKEEDVRKTAFDKFSSSMLRGHSLDGSAGVTLKLHGSKLLDSALTGLVFSRSFVTSGRRAKISKENIIIPEAIDKNHNLRKEYLKTSETAIDIYNKIIEKTGSKQLAAKVVSYNNPCDLYIVLPLSSITTIALELEQQKKNNQVWLPREVEELISRLEDEILFKIDMKIMYETRKAALRDTYLHWYPFKPKDENFASEMAELTNSLEPELIAPSINIQPTKGLREKLKYLEEKIKYTHTISDPKELVRTARENLLLLRDIVDSYNDSISIKTTSSLSWRVWSEQKRHSTLKQCVESVYKASDRAYNIIEEARNNEDFCKMPEKAFVIPQEIKKDKELLKDYVLISSEQHLLRKKLLSAGIEERDAIYVVPRNTILRTVENYDLINMIDLELPLRTCTTCEPERRTTAEKKAEIISEIMNKIGLPEISYMIGPKCILGYCTEPKFCGKILKYNSDYSISLHNQVRENLIKEVSDKIRKIK